MYYIARPHVPCGAIAPDLVKSHPPSPRPKDSLPKPVVPTLSASVVIPAKDEARNIGWVLQRMPSFVDEVIVVDGLSRDGTREVAKMIAPDAIAIHGIAS